MDAMDASESHVLFNCVCVCVCVCVCARARACVYEVCARSRSRMRGETVQSKQIEHFMLPAHAWIFFFFFFNFMSRVSDTFFIAISNFNPLCHSELET